MAARFIQSGLRRFRSSNAFIEVIALTFSLPNPHSSMLSNARARMGSALCSTTLLNIGGRSGRGAGLWRLGIHVHCARHCSMKRFLLLSAAGDLAFLTASARRWTGGALVLALVQSGLCAHAGVIERVRDGSRLVVGYRESSVPFSYVDPAGHPMGYALDLCLKIADALRKRTGVKAMPVDFVLVSTANRIEMVEKGKVDMECGSTTNNADRRQKVAFTIPHFITGARLLVRADSKINRIEDLEGKKLVSTRSTTPLKAAEQANRERLLRIQILEAPDHARSVEMVERGEADAFVMDDVLLFGLAANRPDPGKLKVVGRFLTTEPLAIMIPKNDVEFKRLVDDEMRRLIYSHEINEIYRKWFLAPIPPRNTTLNLPESYLLKDFWKYPTDVVP
jgi:glutamate/aspartate transport system substrate-binding protein